MYTAPALEPAPPMVSTLGIWGALQLTGPPASATFELANRAAYIPLIVPATCVIRRLWWANGATVSASYNVDCGVYRDAGHKPGAKLISTGSTAQGTASQIQFVDVTDTVLAPGLYWIAMVCSSASATFFRSSALINFDATARFMETSALPLPATATPVAAAATGANNLYLCGFATTASP